MAINDAHSRDKACFFLDIPEYNNPTPGIMIHTKAPETITQTIEAPSYCADKSVVQTSFDISDILAIQLFVMQEENALYLITAIEMKTRVELRL